MNYSIYYSIFLFMMTCLLFSFTYKHILLTLINMEFMIINVIYNMYMMFMILKMNIYFLSLFLTISVCESIIGLSILIFIVRVTGNDLYKTLNMNKW